MDINHEDKNLGEPLDINDAVNDLVEKTVTIVESPEDVTSKQINDIKTALENLKGVDKTLNYELFPETREKLKKIKNDTPELEYQNKPSINKPEKENNEIEETRNETVKNTKEIENPTEAQRKEYNEIINERLDRTIKTLEEIEEATNTEGKNEQEIEASKILSGKIARKVVLEFLSNGVKKLAQVETPEEKEEKKSNEMDLNPDNVTKNDQPIKSSSSINKKEKSSKEIERNSLSETFKNTQEVDAYSTEVTEKNINNLEKDFSFEVKETTEVGGLVDIINSEINSAIRANNTEIEDSVGGENKEINNTPAANEIAGKLNNPIIDDSIDTRKKESQIDSQVADINKENREIQQAPPGPEKEENEFSTVKGEDKTNNEIQRVNEGDRKNENEIIARLEDGKTQTNFEDNTEFIYKDTKNIEEAQLKTSKQNNSLEDYGVDANIDSQTPRKRLYTEIGEEDNSLNNSIYRNDNSSASLQGADRKKSGIDNNEESGTQLYGQYNTINDQGLTETVEYDATVGASRENRENKLEEEINANIETNGKTLRGLDIDKASLGENKSDGPNVNLSYINRIGKEDIIGSLLNTYFLFNLAEVTREAIKDARRFNTEEGARQLSQNLSDLEIRNTKYKSLVDEQDPTRGEGLDFISNVLGSTKKNRENLISNNNPENRRSFTHKSHPRNTGYLRIYTRRSTDIEGTLLNEEDATTKMIPFQFEPGYSGDSKKAEYSSIGTLGRSGSAKVYTKSQERSIQLTLDYVVTGPRIGETSNPEDTGHSNSSAGMNEWSEDYIYNFIVPNLRNLVKPNVGQGSSRKFRLGPPIIQVWYGGLDSNGGSSTGQWNARNGSRDAFKNIPPIFLTTWMVEGMDMITYRSLWLPQSVDLEYSGGIVNYKSRNKVRVTAEISLVEIGPSITANEILNWWKKPARQ